MLSSKATRSSPPPRAQGYRFSTSAAEKSTQQLVSMLFTILAALAQMENEIKRERITDSVKKRRDTGLNCGGYPCRITGSQIRNAIRLVHSGEPAAQVARDLGMSRATFCRRARAITD